MIFLSIHPAHQIIGDIITVLLSGIALTFALVTVFIALFKWADEFRDEDLDLIGSHLVGADGKWDFSKAHDTASGAPRHRIHKPAYQVGSKDFEGWEDVVYDGDNFEVIPEAKEQEERQEFELELSGVDFS